VTRCVDLGKTELLLPHVQSSILPLLFSLAASNNEAARLKVQDCLGKLLMMAPAEVMDSISGSSSGGDALARSSVFGCLRYYTSSDDATDALVLPGAIAMVAKGVTDPEPEVRLNAVRATSCLLPKPKYFRVANDSMVNALLEGIMAETRYVNVVEEVMGNVTLKTDMGVDNREAAFLCLCIALEHLEDKVPTAAVMEAAAMGCGDKEGVVARNAALKIVQVVASNSTCMLSEHISGLKDAVLNAIKDSRTIRKESEADFVMIKGFIMALRDTLDNFKEAEPAHTVFGELEAGLDKQRALWAKSNVQATRELVALVDEFRGMSMETGAECEV